MDVDRHGPATAQPVARLINELARLPGIGPKRHLAWPIIFFGHRETKPFHWPKRFSMSKNGSGSAPSVSTRPKPIRARSVAIQHATATICVVEEPLDVVALERTGQFKGRYHVLHGAVSPVEGIGPDQLKIRELIERVERESPEEVIVATNLDLPGEATATYFIACWHRSG